MAQNVTVAGASYSDVPSVTLPKTGGGTASFTDVTGTTALAADVASGKYFFTASGVLTLGTATSGGGAVTQDADGYLVLSDQGGGSSITVEPLSVTSNGTYTAQTGKAYSPVTVSVGNSYTASDEGKVVSNGALVAQTARASSITANGTYDTTNNNSVTVNVSGGDSPYTLLDSSEFSVSTTSTTATSVGTITMGNSLYTANAIIYVKVRDKAGKRKGCFYGTDTFFVNPYAAKDTSQSLIAIRPSILYSFDANGLTKFNPTSSGFVYANNTGSYGVYASNITGSGDVVVQSRYSSNTGTIDGTYTVNTYLLKWPDNTSPISSVV